MARFEYADEREFAGLLDLCMDDIVRAGKVGITCSRETGSVDLMGNDLSTEPVA